MDLYNKLDVIDREIAKGLKMRAADRLRNLLGYYPDELIIREKLAKLYYDAGFFDAAGKYWILTKPTEDHIKKCVEMYEKSVNYSGNQILKELVFRGDRSKLSLYAQHKLEALEANSKSKVGTVPTYKRKYFATDSPNGNVNGYTLRHKLNDNLGCVLIAFIALLVVSGFVAVINVIWSFLFG
jgi:hypothetical protein